MTRRERLIRFLKYVYPYAHWAFPITAAILMLCTTYILLGPVINRSGDNMYHLLNEFAMLRGIRVGDNPFGPLAMEFGQPVLRFYQSLYYLFNVYFSLVFHFSLKFIHNLTIIVCFCLSPFAYLYFLRKLGLNRWAAGFASFASITSIAAFGNSFEAYHQAGIVTQSMGGLFFPWFMGHFVGVLRGENRASTAAVLFALAFLSHAIMSVFAVFAGALYVAVTSFEIRSVAKKISVFGILGASLVAFWLGPFLEHNYRMRPIPDSIIRGSGVHWFTSVSKAELGMVLFTGRLLDDPPILTSNKEERSEEDKLMDRISIIGTLKTRFPMITLLAGLGALFSLFNLRRPSRRFLLAGFFFSLMLFAGPDDFPWLRYMPFMRNIQTFRCTYLIEFFAFGLVGIAIETVLRYWFQFATGRRKSIRIPLLVLWVLAVAGVIGVNGTEIILLGRAHLHTRDTGYLDLMISAASTVKRGGRPYRLAALYEGRYKLRQAWFGMYGYPPYCTHWKGTGPTAAYHLCTQLGHADQYGDLYALAGVRYFSGVENKLKRLLDAKDEDGVNLVYRIASGKDRRGKDTGSWHTFLETGRDHFLRPLVGKPLPVVCTHKQWIWLAKAWTGRYRGDLWEENTPIPMRVDAGKLAESDIVDVAEAVVYLDHSNLESDRAALEKAMTKGVSIISPVNIPGLDMVIPTESKTIWDALPQSMKIVRRKHGTKFHREERDPGLDVATVTLLREGSSSVQNFAFDVDLLRPIVAILPMQAAPGWGAILDGISLPSFPAGPDMVGVFLPKGAHRLVFSWRMPMRDKLWGALSLLAFGFILLIWLRAIRIRIRKLKSPI